MELTYKQYLKEIGILTEKEFNEIIDNCPCSYIDEENLSFDESYGIKEDEYKECLYHDLIDSFLQKYDTFIDEINVSKKQISLYEYSKGISIYLDNIKDVLCSKGWIITNYDELKHEEEIKSEFSKKHDLLSVLARASVEELKQIIKEKGYDKK